MGNIHSSSFPAKARGTANHDKERHSSHSQPRSDKEGRVLIVTGEIYSTPLTLFNTYAPNIDNPAFFNKMMSRIPDMSPTNLVIGGDFDCVLEPSLLHIQYRSKQFYQ